MWVVLRLLFLKQPLLHCDAILRSLWWRGPNWVPIVPAIFPMEKIAVLHCPGSSNVIACQPKLEISGNLRLAASWGLYQGLLLNSSVPYIRGFGGFEPPPWCREMRVSRDTNSDRCRIFRAQDLAQYDHRHLRSTFKHSSFFFLNIARSFFLTFLPRFC